MVRVLVVDDSPYFRLLLRSIFDAHDGFEVVAEADDGVTAIERAGATEPDVIVLDWQMPVMTGLAALPGLRRHAPSAVIVMYSSAGEPDASALAVGAGADLYLDKSVGPNALMVSIRRLLDTGAGAGDEQRVLVVDMDASAAALVASELGAAQILRAGSLAAARALLDGGLSAVVICDVLPDGHGADLLPDVRQRCPDAKVVLRGGPDDRSPAWMLRVPDADVSALTNALALLAPPRHRPAPALTAGASVAVPSSDRRALVHAVVEEWSSLSATSSSLRSDAPDANVVAGSLLGLLEESSATWPTTDDLGVLAPAHGSPQDRLAGTVERLVLLRAAVHRRLPYHVSDQELPHRYAAVNDAIDRALAIAVRRDVDELHDQAHTDVLTGLSNRRAFERDVELEAIRSHRYQRPFTVMILDLDGLKVINDRDGHHAGDDALQAFATAVAGAVRDSDRPYRIGGDEFAVILPETEGGVAATIIRRLCGGVPAFSWGAATYPHDAADRHALVTLADRRMYDRKVEGRTP